MKQLSKKQSPPSRSYREQFDSAMACQTKAEAEAWLKNEIEFYWREYHQGETEALRVIRANLGYMAGYYDHETAQKVVELFGAVHPIFGTATYHNDVSPEAAVEAGRTVGAALNNSKF